MSAIKDHRLRVMNMGFTLFLLVLCVACTAAVKADDPFSNGRLLAENSVLKKRVPLIERENDVLGKENSQYRSKIKELESRIKQLELELTALNAKYANDMAAGAETIRSLQQLIENMGKENVARIEGLQAQNALLEQKRLQEARTFRERMARQKEASDRDREQLVMENEQRTSKLADEIDELKKTLKNRALELSSYKLAIGEISARLGEATALAEEMKKARDATLAELVSVKAAHADLVKKMAASSPAVASPESQSQANH